jgi:UV excision repair protein RAD23
VRGLQQKEKTLTELVNMGFERALAERALQAAFYNQDRAVEYLISGIPQELIAPV